jgi:hypothetical protein
MKLYLRLVYFSLALTLASALAAQPRKSAVSSRFRAPTMSRAKAAVLCPITQRSAYPYQGIGFKMGDPLALTYKFYPNKNWALTADLGKSASGLYNRYYRSLLSQYLPDSLSSEQSVNYVQHRVRSDWFLETKFLHQWDVSGISKGLQLYAGLGLQWRSTTLEYDYLFTDQSLPEGGQFGQFSRTRITYGPVATVGFEYAYQYLPVSAFIEVVWFTDVLLDPGYQRFQGGVGLRYIF